MADNALDRNPDWIADDGPEPPFTDAELAEAEALLAELRTGDHELVSPPAGLWAAIAREADVEASDAALAEPVGEVSETPGAEPADAGLGQLIDLASRRRRRFPVVLAAAAAVVVIAIVGATRPGSEGTVVAAADLVYDPEAYDPLGAEAAAHAELVETDDGYRVRLDEVTLPSEEGSDLELWLIKPDDQGGVADLVAVDIIDGATEFAVPAGYDPSEFSVVDISVEPHDGNASHSGRTILRAPLQF